MALRIRLRRMGRKNAPTYRIVVAESTMPRDGRIVESLGHYNPRTDPLTLKVDRERALYWLGNGAVPTETAKALLKRAGVFRPESEVAESVTESTKRVAKKAAGAAKAAVQAVAEEVRELAADAREAVSDVVEDVREAAAEVAEEIRERVASARGSDEEGEAEQA